MSRSGVGKVLGRDTGLLNQGIELIATCFVAKKFTPGSEPVMVAVDICFART